MYLPHGVVGPASSKRRRRPSYLGRHGQVVGGGRLAEARVVEGERGRVAAERDGGKQEHRRADPRASVGNEPVLGDAGEGASELRLREEATGVVEEACVGDVNCGICPGRP